MSTSRPLQTVQMDPGKMKTLINWVNSTGIDTPVEDFAKLRDGIIVTDIIKYMQMEPNGTTAYALPSTQPWAAVRNFLSGTHLADPANHVEWNTLEDGNKFELAKVLLLLLSLTITCPNKDRLITEMTSFDYESQNHIRHILMEALDENVASGQHFFEVLMQKAPTNEQPEVDVVDSPGVASAISVKPLVNSLADSPISTVPDRSTHIANRGACIRTPVKEIFRLIEDEEVYYSVPSSCPPHRRGLNPRLSFHELQTVNAPNECSPMQEFLSSPVVSYRIKIRDLDQKVSVFQKNLQVERLMREECVKALAEKETAMHDLERKIRDLSRSSVEKQQLFDEIDELHAIRMERDSLVKENTKLKYRLDKYDTYTAESKDLKRDLDEQIQMNDELTQQVASLRSNLDKVANENHRTEQLEESVQSSLQRISLQDQEIAQLSMLTRKLKAQLAEQKELYESKISNYESIIEDRDYSGIENQGESMGIFMEHRVSELQETIKEMENNWTRPDAAARLNADLKAAKEVVEQYQAKIQLLTSEKVSLEEDDCQLRHDVAARAGETMDALKKLASANQKLKHSEAASEALRAQVETLADDKESLKQRVKVLENDILESSVKLSKIEMELNVSRNENESNTVALASHVRRSSDYDQKIADFEQKCRYLAEDVAEKSLANDELKKLKELQAESFEKKASVDKEKMSEMEDKIRILEREKEAGASQIQEVNKDLLQKKQLLLDAKEEIESLKIEVKRYHSSCSELEAECSGLKAKLKNCGAAFEKKLTFKQQEIAGLMEEEAVSKKNILVLEEESKKMKKELDSVAEDLRISCENLLRARNDKKYLDTEKNRLEEEVQKGLGKLKDSLASQEFLEDDLEAAKMELESEKRNLSVMTKERESKILSLENIISHEKERFSRLEDEVRAQKDTLISRSKELEEVRLSMCQQEEEHQSKMDENKNTLSDKDNESSSLRIALGEQDTKCKDLEELIKNLQSTKAQLEKDVRVYQEENTLIKDSLSEAKSRIEEQKDVVRKMQEETMLKQEILENDISGSQEEIESLKAFLEESKKETAVFRLQTESSVAELEVMKLKNARMTAETEESSKALNRTKNDLAESCRIRGKLGDELDAAQQALAECKISEANHADEIREIKDKLDEESRKRFDSEIRLNELEGQNIRYQEESVAMKKDFESKQEKMNSLEHKVTMMEKQMEIDLAVKYETVADLTRVKTEVESSEKNHVEDLLTLNANIQLLQENRRTSEEKHKDAVEELENVIKSQSDDLEELRNERDGIRENRDEAHREVEDLKKMLESFKNEAQSEIDTLNENMKEEVLKRTSLQEKLESAKSISEKQNQANDRTAESLRTDLLQKVSLLGEVNLSRRSLQGEVTSLQTSLEELEQGNKREMEFFQRRLEVKDSALEEAASTKTSLEAQIESLRTALEEHNKKTTTTIESLEEDVAQKNAKVEELQLANASEYEGKMKELEARLVEAIQNSEYLKVENESLKKNIDVLSRDHTEKMNLVRATSDETARSLKNETERSTTLEERLQELLRNEAEAKNLARVLEEKRIAEEKLKENLTCLQSELKRVREEKLEFQAEAESAGEQKKNAEDKVKVIRAQFTEKYREKQEKILDLERNLKDWQARADEQTRRYDEIAAMYDEKRGLLNETMQDLNQVREENLDLQEAVRDMKAEIGMLTTNRSQLNFKKIEEEKKIRALSAEVQRLKTQLQHAERQIRESRNGSRPSNFRHSWGQPLTTVQEVTTPRRRSLEMNTDDMFSDENLFRCRSDTYLDSPSTANRKVRKRQEQNMDDSLEDILRTPVSLHSGDKSKANLNDALSASAGNCGFIDGSLVTDTPSRVDQRRHGQSLPHLDVSRSSQGSTDVNMNSMSLTETSFLNASGESGERFFSTHRHHNPLALQTEEEPEDYEWGSLSRIAELQRRNAATLPHLQSSYPVETQGQTPSKSDESVRIGNADRTLRRMTQIPSTLQRSLADGARMSEAGTSRRMTLDVHGDLLRVDRDAHATRRYASSDSLHSKRKNAGADAEWENAQRKDGRALSCSGLEGQEPPTKKNSWRNEILSQEDKEQMDPSCPDRRASLMFEIPNSPKRPALRSRAAKKVQDENVAGASKRASSAAMKTPDRSRTSKKNQDEKRRTPSLMDRVKKPLSRFNRK